MSCSQTRLARLREVMAAEGLDAFYVRDLANQQWLTAFDGIFDGEGAHALFVSADQVLLHTDTRYAPAMERAARGTGVVVDASVRPHPQVVADWYRAWCAGEGEGDGGQRALADTALGIEVSMTLAEYRALVAAFGEAAPKLRETDRAVLRLRGIKDAGEVRRLKEAQAVTDAAFSHIVGYMQPGMTEREVQIELEDFMCRHGAEGPAFSSIVAAGENAACPHAVPGGTRIQAGQAVVLDFGARVQGYCSDMTRTVFLGQPDARLADAYAVLRRANEEVASMLCPGITGAEAHARAEAVLAEGGYAGLMGHALGHGVGLELHEEPVLSRRNTEVLVEGNVVTVEPGIYIPGDFGMRLEDFGVITPGGFEVFTQSTHKMVVI